MSISSDNVTMTTTATNMIIRAPTSVYVLSSCVLPQTYAQKQLKFKLWVEKLELVTNTLSDDEVCFDIQINIISDMYSCLQLNSWAGNYVLGFV